VTTKNDSTKVKISPPPLLVLLLDPESGIQDPGWIKTGIRDKHSGSATQFLRHIFATVSFDGFY
jgi:hypothetical protein